MEEFFSNQACNFLFREYANEIGLIGKSHVQARNLNGQLTEEVRKLRIR